MLRSLVILLSFSATGCAVEAPPSHRATAAARIQVTPPPACTTCDPAWELARERCHQDYARDIQRLGQVADAVDGGEDIDEADFELADCYEEYGYSYCVEELNIARQACLDRGLEALTQCWKTCV